MRRQILVNHLFARLFRWWNFALVAVCLAAASTGSVGTIRAQSALDGFDPNANGSVYAILVQPDGKILLAGDFTTIAPHGGTPVTRNRIARLNPDGSLDNEFNAAADNLVTALALQSDGKVLVAGNFTTVSGQARRYIARLDGQTGAVDAFAPDADHFVRTLLLQPDGKLLVGGIFSNIGGQSRKGIARLDTATGLADSFDANSQGSVSALAIDRAGKLLVAGDFTSIGGQLRNRIARLDLATGAADAFNPNADGDVQIIALQADGRIIVGGMFHNIGGQMRHYLARLDPVTGMADSFRPNPNNLVSALTVQADGKILVGGSFGGPNSIGGQTRHSMARLDPATGLADAFDPEPNGAIVAMAVQADGKVLIGGSFFAVASNGGATVTRNHIARLETDGRLDQTLENPLIHRGSDIQKTVRAIAVQPDGKIIIAGLFTSVLGVNRNHIARLNTDGTLDTAFDPDLVTPSYSASSGDGVASIVVQPDGKILVGGYFVKVGGQWRRNLARLDPLTGSADSFNPDPDSKVESIVATADGKIVVGGHFSSIGGQARSRIARLNTTTGLADSFNPNADASVHAIAVDREGKLLVSGAFTSIGGKFRNRIARLDPSTAAADSFNPNANAYVSTLAIQGDGRVLAAGSFSYMSGQPRRHIARIDPVTGLADAFNPSPDSQVYSVALQADGKILLGGSFLTIDGQERARIARLDPATGVPDSFTANVDRFVEAIALQRDGKVLVGGAFANVGGLPRSLLARLSNDTAALQHLNVTPAAVTWTRDGSGPSPDRVTFESSTDGVNYSLLGQGNASGSEWRLTGLSLPLAQDVFVRASGHYCTGAGNASESTTQTVRHAFFTSPLQLATAVSRKTHGNAGEFDIELPLNGEPAVECRSSGGAHTLVFTFSNNIASGTASLTTGSGTVSEAPTFLGDTMIVKLADVADAQKITVTLNGVTNSFGQVLPDTAVRVKMLVGDINASRVVNASDIGAVKAQLGVPVTEANFRADVAVSGAITATDIGLVKSRSGQALP